MSVRVKDLSPEERMVRSQLYYQRNKDRILAQRKRRARLNIRAERSRKFPEQVKAHNDVNRAIKYGKLIRPEVCEMCGKEGDIESHHADYSKPFEIVWACSKCHAKLDATRRAKLR